MNVRTLYSEIFTSLKSSDAKNWISFWPLCGVHMGDKVKIQLVMQMLIDLCNWINRFLWEYTNKTKK